MSGFVLISDSQPRVSVPIFYPTYNEICAFTFLDILDYSFSFTSLGQFHKYFMINFCTIRFTPLFRVKAFGIRCKSCG